MGAETAIFPMLFSFDTACIFSAALSSCRCGVTTNFRP